MGELALLMFKIQLREAALSARRRGTTAVLGPSALIRSHGLDAAVRIIGIVHGIRPYSMYWRMSLVGLCRCTRRRESQLDWRLATFVHRIPNRNNLTLLHRDSRGRELWVMNTVAN